MLPPKRICQERIQAFRNQHPNSRFDQFWGYKLETEKSGASILDDVNRARTAKHLGEVIRDQRWGMRRTGTASDREIEKVLSRTRPQYEDLRSFNLGSGAAPQHRTAFHSIFAQLCGITNTANIEPQGSKLFITGKSKVLMLLLGQSPGFDKRVRERFASWKHEPPPYCIDGLNRRTRLCTPDQFCDIVEELDRWVLQWPRWNDGMLFKDLWPEQPVGRIIDVIYWVNPSRCR